MNWVANMTKRTRHKVFETNSSSSHSISFGGGFKLQNSPELSEYLLSAMKHGVKPLTLIFGNRKFGNERGADKEMDLTKPEAKIDFILSNIYDQYCVDIDFINSQSGKHEELDLSPDRLTKEMIDFSGNCDWKITERAEAEYNQRYNQLKAILNKQKAAITLYCPCSDIEIIQPRDQESAITKYTEMGPLIYDINRMTIEDLADFIWNPNSMIHLMNG